MYADRGDSSTLRPARLGRPAVPAQRNPFPRWNPERSGLWCGNGIPADDGLGAASSATTNPGCQQHAAEHHDDRREREGTSQFHAGVREI